MKKPEKWFQFLGAGQKLVYILLSLMPLQYQRENLEAMLSRFLEDLLDTRYLNMNNSYFHLYAFEGKAGQQVTIEMKSSQIDSHLYLLLPGREKLVAENDDISPTDFNSRLTVTLPENGIYYVLANTFEAGESGNYSLRAVAQ